MSSLKSDDDDFWTDCLKDTSSDILQYNPTTTKKYKNNTYQNNQTKNIIQPTNFSKKPKIPILNFHKKTYKTSTMKTTFPKNKKISDKLFLEESKEQKRRNNKIDALITMYKRGMETKKLKNKNNENLRELKKKNEISECSFKPKKFSNQSFDKKMEKKWGGSTIYERGLKYQQRHQAKLAKLYGENSEKKNVIYSFHPEILYSDLNKVFYSVNFCKEQADNDSNKIFLFRLMKAREEQMYKQYILENPIRPSLRKNWSVPGMLKRTVSQKDSCMLQKGLHESLLEIKCTINTGVDNEENDEYKNGENNDNKILGENNEIIADDVYEV